jgi:hypothetical protein
MGEEEGGEEGGGRRVREEEEKKEVWFLGLPAFVLNKVKKILDYTNTLT